MKRGALRLLLIGIAGGVCYAGMCFFSCGPTNPTKSTSLNDLVLTDQINGWVVDSVAGYFVESTMANYVDGGSSNYCGSCSLSTLKEGFKMLMGKPPTVDKLRFYVINYGTAANAKAEFDFMVQGSSWTTENALSPYSVTDVFYTSNSDGVNAHAHFKNFYIELQLTAFGSSSEAVPDAKLYIDYFHSKIGQ